jgi:hypothetical protein
MVKNSVKKIPGRRGSEFMPKGKAIDLWERRLVVFIGPKAVENAIDLDKPLAAAVKKWDWLRAGTAKTRGIWIIARCLSQFFHSLAASLPVPGLLLQRPAKSRNMTTKQG